MNGNVYLIGCDEGYYKIGNSAHPGRRLGQLQPGCPFHLSLSHVIPCHAPDWLEYQLHHFFTAKHIRLAGEWFRLTPEDVAKVKSVRECLAPDDLPSWLPLVKVPAGRRKTKFRHLFAEIPEVLWNKLAADAEDGNSIAAVLTTILRKHYRVPESDLPRRGRAGRPRSKKKEEDE